MGAGAELDVRSDRPELMRAGADLFARRAREACGASGRFVVALSGGSTPKDLYTLLATDPYASNIAWSQVHVCWGDERCVAPDDAASNYRMAREILLDRVPVPAENIHRIRGEEQPADAAATYEQELRALFHTPAGPPRLADGARFDLVLLGMGDDGHTASLFPHQAALRERQRWAVATRAPTEPPRRVTLTVPLINAAAEVAFLVAGEGKAPMLRQVLRGPRIPERLPAQAIAPRSGRLRWLVDALAAADVVES